MRQSRIVPDHCGVEILVGYHAVFVDVEGAEPQDRLLYFVLCQLAKRARKAAIVLPPGLVVLHDPFGHTAANSWPAANSAASSTAVRRATRAAARRAAAFWSGFGPGGVINRGKNLNMHMHMYHARVMCVCAYSFLLIAGCSLSLHGLQIPTEDRDSLRMAMESRNGHKLVARIMLRPSEVRSMTLTQALA